MDLKGDGDNGTYTTGSTGKTEQMGQIGQVGMLGGSKFYKLNYDFIELID